MKDTLSYGGGPNTRQLLADANAKLADALLVAEAAKVDRALAIKNHHDLAAAVRANRDAVHDACVTIIELAWAAS